MKRIEMYKANLRYWQNVRGLGWDGCKARTFVEQKIKKYQEAVILEEQAARAREMECRKLLY